MTRRLAAVPPAAIAAHVHAPVTVPSCGSSGVVDARPNAGSACIGTARAARGTGRGD
jgi:hypothetical protein